MFVTLKDLSREGRAPASERASVSERERERGTKRNTKRNTKRKRKERERESARELCKECYSLTEGPGPPNTFEQTAYTRAYKREGAGAGGRERYRSFMKRVNPKRHTHVHALTNGPMHRPVQACVIHINTRHVQACVIHINTRQSV